MTRCLTQQDDECGCQKQMMEVDYEYGWRMQMMGMDEECGSRLRAPCSSAVAVGSVGGRALKATARADGRRGSAAASVLAGAVSLAVPRPRQL